jgi:hypothetical protein
MKYFILLFSMFLAATANVLAQTASDYYTHLGIGSHVTLHTIGTVGSGWADRSTTYAIEGSDSISGRKYFREKGSEMLDVTGETDVFRVFWLRKDSAGNVALGAMNTSTGSSDIDSAMIVSAGNWFPNDFLTKGYSRSYPYGNQTMQDSVLSVTETVNVSGGNFNNCLEVSTTHFDSAGTPVFREYQYYASGIGLVKNVRTLPGNQAHTDELIGYVTTGVSNGAGNQVPRDFSLSQNYPNPFNPSTTITFSVGTYSHTSLRVYDVLGREVATLVNEQKPAGTYTQKWNAASMPSGIYFYRLQAGSLTETKKLILLK